MPVRMVARLGEHSDEQTTAFGKYTPFRARKSIFGVCRPGVRKPMASKRRSSTSTKTMLYGFACVAARAATGADASTIATAAARTAWNVLFIALTFRGRCSGTPRDSWKYRRAADSGPRDDTAGNNWARTDANPLSA